MESQNLTMARLIRTAFRGPWPDEILNTGFSSVWEHPKTMLLGLPCARCKAYFAARPGNVPDLWLHGEGAVDNDVGGVGQAPVELNSAGSIAVNRSRTGAWPPVLGGGPRAAHEDAFGRVVPSQTDLRRKEIFNRTCGSLFSSASGKPASTSSVNGFYQS